MQAPVSKEELMELLNSPSSSKDSQDQDLTAINSINDVEETLEMVENTCELDKEAEEKKDFELKKVESEAYSKHE